MNALRLVAQHKTAVVYVGPEKAFSEIRSRGDFDQLAARLSGAAARRPRDRAVQEGLYEREEEQAPLQLLARDPLEGPLAPETDLNSLPVEIGFHGPETRKAAIAPRKESRPVIERCCL
jgi:hypothetical protein